MTPREATALVQAARKHQLSLRKLKIIPWCTNAIDVASSKKLAILTEYFGVVGKAVARETELVDNLEVGEDIAVQLANEERTLRDGLAELIATASMWLEALPEKTEK